MYSFEGDKMENKCSACGGETFVKGKMSGYAKVFPAERMGMIGSNLLLTVCESCGEVASMKVENPHRLK